MKEYNKKYYRSHKKELQNKNRQYARNLRNAVLDILGRKCIKCGFDDIRALQIDHINGGGSKDRKKNGGKQFYLLVLNSLSQEKTEYQMLCANCNWIKRVENNENKK